MITSGTSLRHGALACLVSTLLACAPSSPPDAPTERREHAHAHGAPHEHEASGHPHPGHHRFESADEWARHFESPERDAWQKPDAVVDLVGLGAAQTLADIGSGTGYFAVRFARKAPQGRVYGVDIEPDMVRYMTERGRREQLANFTPVLASLDDARLPAPVDVVFLCDTYHHIEQRTAYFQKIVPSLKPGGRVVIVDFKKIETPVGPRLEHRVTPAQVDTELAPAGLRRTHLDEQTLPYQYILTYERG